MLEQKEVVQAHKQEGFVGNSNFFTKADLTEGLISDSTLFCKGWHAGKVLLVSAPF
jgi:hypothetical protein